MSLDRVKTTLRCGPKWMLVGTISLGCLDSASGTLRADEQDLQNQLQPPAAAPSQPRQPLRVEPLQIPDIAIPETVTGGSRVTPEDLVAGRLPDPIPLPYGPDRDGGWAISPKPWIAPVYCHQPTYYEDMMLEQHGHEICPPMQPMISGARFYSGIFFTPYLVCLHPPRQDMASAGPFRPGSRAPALRQRAPYDAHALGTQAIVTGAGVALLQP